jgi:hypothetical protein
MPITKPFKEINHFNVGSQESSEENNQVELKASQFANKKQVTKPEKE